MKAQRMTNICYPKGSVIMCKFNKESEFSFMDSRPLIVVSNQTQMFNTLTVITCGSKDRPGIEVSLYNHKMGKYIGDHQYTIAHPYCMYTIQVFQIKDFFGVIDPYTMKAIDKSIAFHLGLSDEIPPYMKTVYEALLEPRYNNATEANTQLKDVHSLGSWNEISREFAKNEISSPDAGRPYYLASNKNSATQASSEPKDLHKPAKVQIQPAQKEEIIPLATRYDVSSRFINIACLLNEDERCNLLIRKFTPGEYHGYKINATEIGKLRTAVEVQMGVYESSTMTKISARLAHMQRNYKFLSKSQKCIGVLYGSPESLDINDDAFAGIAKQFIKEMGLSFKDKRSWKGFKNFDRLKAINA